MTPEAPEEAKAAAAEPGLAELREALCRRDRFLAIVTHELRNALTPVVSIVDYLNVSLHREGGVAAAQTAAMVGQLSQAMHRYLRRTEVLLEASRLLAGGAYRPMPSTFDLSVLVRDAIGLSRAAAALVGSPIRPDVEPDVVVTADRTAIEIVVDNLLSNAVKYGAGRPITVTLRRAATAAGGSVRIAVRDEGIGIAAVDQVRIFEPFQRAAGATATGFGIGLWVARGIVQACGGELAVERSAPGRGSSFAVTLPLCVSPEVK
jgi:signal transduction histidine kinase